MTFPSSSIFALSVGAGKFTRAMQPSLASAVQRLPPPSVDASSLSRLHASATSSALSSLSRSVFSLISRSSETASVTKLLSMLSVMVVLFLILVSRARPAHLLRRLRDAMALHPVFQRPSPRLVVFLQRSSMSSGILP